MAAANCLLSEEQFRCPICLDTFSQPVSIPCGHNYCKECITQNWTYNDQYQCPICKKEFYTKPELSVNPLLAEMVAQYKESEQQEATRRSSEQQAAREGEVQCDVCTEIKMKALKSCLVCLVSLCETHLKSHRTVPDLVNHQLSDPMENLESRVCTQHSKPLVLFCKSDQTCVCMDCLVTDHTSHNIVPMREEYEGKKAELLNVEVDIHRMIHERQQKIGEMKEWVQLNKEVGDKEGAEGLQSFASLIEIVEMSLRDLMDGIEEKQKATTDQAEAVIREMERETSELRERSSRLERLKRSDDPLLCLQSLPSLKAVPPTKGWSQVRVYHPSFDWMVTRAAAQMEATLHCAITKLLKAKLRTLRLNKADVTLDPKTANAWLVLSDDGKQVSTGEKMKTLPDDPERFSKCTCVLGTQSFSAGRFYFEVQVRGKTSWSLGLARQSVGRKGDITLCPRNGYWTIYLREGNQLAAFDNRTVPVSLKSLPQSVGVFLDYEEGLVSFHDVDTAALIYSYTGCNFTEGLLPFLSPYPNVGGKNSAPMIITPKSEMMM